MLDEIEPQLTDEFPAVRMRYLLERGRTFNSSRQPDRARPLFLEAWEYGLVRAQVTRLGRDYGTLAATLRGHWN